MSKRHVVIIAAVILALAFLAIALIRCEDKLLNSSEYIGMGAGERYDEMRKIYIGGEAYLPKENLETCLIIGLDIEGEREASEAYANGIQSDLLLLFAIDRKNESYTIIQLDRDTMADIDLIGPKGEVTTKRYAQLALAHAYGNGLEQSGENTVRAVSRLLYGVKIDNYVSATMDAVRIVNDAVGGVPITFDDNYTELDPRYVKDNRITLKGSEALQFVRARGSMNDPTNIARMKRQRLYLTALSDSMKNGSLDDGGYTRLIDDLLPYIVTDYKITEVDKSLEFLTEYTCSEIINPEGISAVGDDFMEFHINDEELKELVISLFYTKVSDED